MNQCPRNESFADGNVGAGVRLMVIERSIFASDRE